MASDHVCSRVESVIEPAAPGRIGRILLVDNEIVRQAAVTVLLITDFLVDTASTAAEGVRRLTESPPDLVIYNTAFPDCDGLWFWHALRGRLPACPVIVMTTAERPESRWETDVLSIEGICQQPHSVGKLLEQIQALCARRGQTLCVLLPLRRPICRAIAHINRFYTHPLTVATVADAIGVSSSHLAHLFRTELGMTVRDYWTKLRIEVVKRLLLHTEETLASIAASVGFCDASHLARLFRRHMECWPSEYRRRPQGLVASHISAPRPDTSDGLCLSHSNLQI